MITKRFYDYHTSGIPVYAYTIKGDGIISATVINYGATLNKLEVEDKDGIVRDVVGGFDNIINYVDSGEYQGSSVGRVGNRLKNAEFVLDGVKYQTYRNEKMNSCHSGRFGFDKKLWDVAYDENSTKITFSYTSPDGEEGFPGTLKVNVTYEIVGNELQIHYDATTDKKTIINLTNHSYFNMNGYNNGNMENHIIRLNSDKFNETDVQLIPTGKFTDVTGTAFDMRNPVLMKDVLFGDHDKIRELGGLDTNFVINGAADEMKYAGDFYSPLTGICMSIYTDQSSVLIYTANRIKDTEPDMKSGVKQIVHFGACFETEAMPDAINQEGFDNVVLDVGDTYSKTTKFLFSNDWTF